MHRFLRRNGRGLAALAAILAVVGAAMLHAGHSAAQQGDRCWLLEQELAAYDRTSGGGDPDRMRRYEAAIQEQATALRNTEAQAERLGCFKRGFLFFQPDRSPQCPQIIDSINQMERNLAQLTAERDQLGGGARGNDPGRQRIVQLLAANRCGPQYSRDANVQRRERGGGFFRELFGREDAPLDGGFTERFDYGGNRTLGDQATYRTLCVRTCDGYYFPISFSTLPQQFEQDAEQCRAQCPSAIVDLYVHRNPGGSVEEMVALNGQPYADMPTAFRYREEYVEGCSCNPYTLALEDAREKETDSSKPGVVEEPAAGDAQQGGQNASALQGENLPSSGEIAPGDNEDGGEVTIFRAGGRENYPAARFNAGQPEGNPNIIRIPPQDGASRGRDAPRFSTGQSGVSDPTGLDPAQQQ